MTETNYNKMTDAQKRAYLESAYIGNNLSYQAIAECCNTYPNRIRRDANRLGIQSRDSSTAQKIALTSGRHKHPTKGTKRTDDTKFKISEKKAADWADLTPKERAARAKTAKDLWDRKSDFEKEEFQRKAGDAVRSAAKDGSKLEKYFLQSLVKEGYKVQFHNEYFVKNESLQIDLFIPKLNTAIEIDGPSHFSPIWGQEKLAKNQRADAQKDGLLLGAGLVVIRVQQKHALSAKYKRDLLAKVLAALTKIDNKFPARKDRHITIGD